ncbi:hypothetical protein ACEWY4_014340 [Coilia grayii]|uniref:Ig-like domain-containing protein n=1 Tax=Coilia grayii TaxID=363190 RepID=A0ABD1JS05_9TELE
MVEHMQNKHKRVVLFLKTALLLLVHGFQGANSLWTVSQVAVQNGSSVTIPCHYHRMFQNHMKYWCKGRNWRTCRELVRTTTKPRKEGVSITDYPSEQVFTITMNSLQVKDTDRYWCAVKIGGFTRPDVRASLELQVTEDPPDLSVRENMVSVEEGGNVTIPCLYIDKLKSSVKMWCESGNLHSCKSALSPTSPEDPSFTISDDGSGVFNVTLAKLGRKDTGWYWCSAGGVQAPVHINVTGRPDGLYNITATTQNVFSVSSWAPIKETTLSPSISSSQMTHVISSAPLSSRPSGPPLGTSAPPKTTPISTVTLSPQANPSKTAAVTVTSLEPSTTRDMTSSAVQTSAVSTASASPRTTGGTPDTYLSSVAPTTVSCTILHCSTVPSNNTDNTPTEHRRLVWQSVVIGIGIIMLLVIIIGACVTYRNLIEQDTIALDDMTEQFNLVEDGRQWKRLASVVSSESQ